MQEYVPMKQLLQFECFNCGRTLVIDPQNVAEMAGVQDQLMVTTAAGAKFAFCDATCARTGIRKIKPSNIVLTDAQGELYDPDGAQAEG